MGLLDFLFGSPRDRAKKRAYPEVPSQAYWQSKLQPPFLVPKKFPVVVNVHRVEEAWMDSGGYWEQIVPSDKDQIVASAKATSFDDFCAVIRRFSEAYSLNVPQGPTARGYMHKIGIEQGKRRDE